MIATLTGRLRRKLEDRVIVETAGVGYEVFLPPIAMRQLEGASTDGTDGAGAQLDLLYVHTGRQIFRHRPLPPCRFVPSRSPAARC